MSEAGTLQGLFEMVSEVQREIRDVTAEFREQRTKLDTVVRALQEPGQDALNTRVRLLEKEKDDIKARLDEAERKAEKLDDRKYLMWTSIGIAVLSLALNWFEAHSPIRIETPIPVQQATH